MSECNLRFLKQQRKDVRLDTKWGRRFFFSGATAFPRGKFNISVQDSSKFILFSRKWRSWEEETIHYHKAYPFLNQAATIARRRTCVSFAQKATTFFMGGLLEPCNILPGNCSAHGVNNSKRFGKCAFRLKKGAVVRKLLHHKVEKVPKNGWWGGGGVMWKWCAPNPATKCMQLLGEHHCITFQLHMQRKDESFNACRFWAPAKCTPTVSQKFHSGAVWALQVARPQSCTKMHATAWRASLHHISTSYAKKRWRS